MKSSYDITATIKAIKNEWAKPVRAYINTGRMLHELKKAVGHGGWEELFNPGGALAEEFRSSDVPRKLIKIAQDQRLTNPAILPVLPRAWTTTYLLATLEEEPFAEVQEAGLIRPDVMGSEIRDFLKHPSRRKQVGPWLAALDEVRAAVDGKGEGSTGIEQAQHCIISGDRVAAYNYDIHISAPLGFDTKIKFTVPADSLHRALSAIQEEDISIRIRQFGGEDFLEIRGDATRVLLSGRRELKSELAGLIGELGLEKLQEDNWKNLPKDFADGLRLCGFGASRNKKIPDFNSICFRKGAIWSTDNVRNSRYIFDDGLALDGMIPLTSANELRKRDLTHYQQAGGWFHFRGPDGLLFSVRTLSVDAPDYEPWFNLDTEGREVSLPTGLLKALKPVVGFTQGDDPTERESFIVFEKESLTIYAQDDSSQIKRILPAPELGELTGVIRIPINPAFLIEILAHTTTMRFDEKLALFETENFTHSIKLKWA